MHSGCKWKVRLHTALTSLNKNFVFHLDTLRWGKQDELTKGSGENIVWCWTSATHTDTQSHKYPLFQLYTHMHKHTGICGQSGMSTLINKKGSNTHILCPIYTHTHTAVHSVEKACWVAVRTYSAAMATSSMVIDSAAKWVRVCERDNLV